MSTTPTLEFSAADQPEQPADRAAADRRAYRRTIRAFRSRRVLSAVLVAAVVTVVAAVVAMETIGYLVDQPVGVVPAGELAQTARDTAWDDPLVFLVAIVAGLIGVFLLLLAFLPGRSRALPAATDRSDTLLAVRPSAVERLAVRAAVAVPGIHHATAVCRRGRLRVRADTGLHDPTGLAAQTGHAVADRLAQFRLLRPPRIRVDLRYREE
ncbi:hypothetical protein JQS43_03375 [Natronosporangium hydrolyticum]|uniref:DUF6286 domain-containing protein n=1 Tax=Natronosporangium hydrolyticum TaxID=2811111 RepID=A0A895YH81_9ACTN|nr:DUF6286 domain-containing protein [Natronosporangium hydrolyticum]QSB15415.1 hypothetical protein JQS43_03375 [Natronosporangium hydrolyticum]